MKNSQQKPYELLAPAGSFAALQAAVQNGADAVYLAGKEFGARKYATNFSAAELEEAVAYCHTRGVNVYVTVNTLVLNAEFARLKAYLDFLYVTGVDAIIVQDLGVLTYLRRTYPDLAIHCSTQMSVQTAADVKFLASLGVKRVILGREMSVAEIRQAKKETGVELEVFVHGALCISVSGQCLMSSLIGGRSGNRGCCAQPCRKKYTLYDLEQKRALPSAGGDYLLSTKDLCTIDCLKEIIDAGAFSLKLEGRMKSPEYVAVVVKAYRSILEAIYSHKKVDLESLRQALKIFNRGFTRGHLFGDRGTKLMSLDSPGNRGYYLGEVVDYNKRAGKMTLKLAADLYQNDEIQIRRKREIIGGRVERLEHKGRVVKQCTKGQICQVNFKHFAYPKEAVYKTYDQKLMQKYGKLCQKEQLTIPVKFKVKIKKDQPLSGSLTDGTYAVEGSTGVIPEKAVKVAVSANQVEAQFAKLGGTPFLAEKIEVDLDQGLAVPVKELNRLRRMLVEKLTAKRSRRYERKSRLHDLSEVKRTFSKKPKTITLTCSASNLVQLEKLLALGVEIIYYKDLKTLPAAVQLVREKLFQGKLIPEIFRLASDEGLQTYKKYVEQLGLDTVLVQSYGHIELFQDYKLVADFNLNIVNDYAYRFYHEKNFARITLSPELNLKQIASFNLDPGKTELVGYGYLPVMVMKHCVIDTVFNRQINCGLCQQSSYGLKDSLNEVFRIVKRDACCTEIYNAKKLFLLENLKALESKGIGYLRLNFLAETAEEVELIVRLYQKAIQSALTQADWEKITQIKAAGITYGHINRGIE
ncbi:MAG: U32 family peptidase [Firmicutes bacterium]|nr:U32 family peptidase [Bacillota bacterium]